MLNALALRSRSVIASNVGTFLYPRAGTVELERPFAGTFAPVLAAVPSLDLVDVAPVPSAVPRLRRSRCSAVSSVPDPAAGVGSGPSLADPAGELERCEDSAGDVERVVGGCTAVESAALELVATEVDDVRARRDVGRR